MIAPGPFHRGVLRLSQTGAASATRRHDSNLGNQARDAATVTADAEAQQVQFAEQAVAAGVKHLVKLLQFAGGRSDGHEGAPACFVVLQFVLKAVAATRSEMHSQSGKARFRVALTMGQLNKVPATRASTLR